MNKRKPTITIGISAYNEEKNICRLLACLLDQKEHTYRLERIIVRSDGSTDMTAKLVKAVRSDKILFLDGTRRIGKALSNNIIIRKTQSDYLLMLDADITLPQGDFIQKIVNSMVSGKLDLGGIKIIPEQTAGNYYSRITAFGHQFRADVFTNLNGGDNWYTCCGAARCLSKKLYTRIVFPDRSGEDLYSYFYTKQYGYRYGFIDSTCARIRLPENFTDHMNQNARFQGSSVQLSDYFSPNIISQNFQMPFLKLILSLARLSLKLPIIGASYVAVNFIFLMQSRLNREAFAVSKWKTPRSTK